MLKKYRIGKNWESGISAGSGLTTFVKLSGPYTRLTVDWRGLGLCLGGGGEPQTVHLDVTCEGKQQQLLNIEPQRRAAPDIRSAAPETVPALCTLASKRPWL